MEFVKKFTPPDFQAKNFTPSISPNFNSFSDKNTKKNEWKWRNLHSWQTFYTAAGSDGIDNDKSFFVHYQSHSEETFNKKYHPSPVLSNKATKKLYLQVLLQFLHFTVSPN